MTAPTPDFLLFYKDPAEVEDYEIAWSPNVIGADTIIIATFSTDDPLLIVSASSFTAATATVTLSGGTLGGSSVTADARSAVFHTITTAGGHVFKRTLWFRIKEK